MPESRRGLNVNLELGQMISVDQSEDSVEIDCPIRDGFEQSRGSMNVVGPI